MQKQVGILAKIDKDIVNRNNDCSMPSQTGTHIHTHTQNKNGQKSREKFKHFKGIQITRTVNIWNDY